MRMLHAPCRSSLTLLLLALAPALTACSAVASEVARGETDLPGDTGVAMGRLSFVTRRKLAIDRFELVAVQIPDGRKYRIRWLPEAGDDDGSFFVRLPAGQYRLTAWQASTAGGDEWAGEDAGLAIDIPAGRVVCVGALLVQPQERRRFSLAEEPPGAAVVRDECAALTQRLRRRAPTLAEAPLVRMARPVGHGPS